MAKCNALDKSKPNLLNFDQKLEIIIRIKIRRKNDTYTNQSVFDTAVFNVLSDVSKNIFPLLLVRVMILRISSNVFNTTGL